MGTLPECVREAAVKAGGVEALRKKAKVSADTIYRTLRGEQPTLRTLRKLQKAGVLFPPDVAAFLKAS